MNKSVQFSQFVAKAINHTTWNIPKIRDGNQWRNIENAYLVENTKHINGYERYEDAIFRIRNFLKQKGWKTEISETKKQCHEHLEYNHLRLRCWK